MSNLHYIDSWPMHFEEDSEVQTRSEETGLIQHKTLQQALTHAVTDLTVWKISYIDDIGRRVRKIRVEQSTDFL